MFCSPLLEFMFIFAGCCCTMGSVIIQRTVPVPGWALNTCLVKLWKHLVTNGVHLHCVLHLYLP